MINNTCIYGTVEDASGDPVIDTTVTMKYIKYDFSKVIEKEYDNSTGAYQFNLGDSDILTMNEASYKNDVVIISNIKDDVVDYSDKVVLQGDTFVENNIVVGDYTENSDEVSAEDGSYSTVVKHIVLEDTSEYLYSYYKVVVDDEIVYEVDSNRLEYLPKVTGEHVITQYGVNSTTGDITSKEWTIDVMQSVSEIRSLDYIFYNKRNKMLRAILPQHVQDTLILEDGWYFDKGVLLGKSKTLKTVEMDYYNGKVIVRGYIGDIIDY